MKKDKASATYDFPPKLIEHQDELVAVRAELRQIYPRLPWSREPAPAWSTHDNYWYPSSRPDSPGWEVGDKTKVEQLRAREVELAQAIVTHPWWAEIAPAERADARSRLKHHRRHSPEETTH